MPTDRFEEELDKIIASGARLLRRLDTDEVGYFTGAQKEGLDLVCYFYESQCSTGPIPIYKNIIFEELTPAQFKKILLSGDGFFADFNVK